LYGIHTDFRRRNVNHPLLVTLLWIDL